MGAAKPARSTRRRLTSFLYHASFTWFLVILAALLVGSAWGLGEQAWRTDHQRRWNMFALIAAYIALLIISLVVVWSRLLSVRLTLRTMPRPYMPTKQIDLPQKVANHIATEYSRTAVIAYISQATAAAQEGWGRLGTRWDGVHFRTFILGTVPEMREILLGRSNSKSSSAPPLSTAPLIAAADALATEGGSAAGKPDPLRIFVASWASIVERARFARAEPSEADAAAVEKVVEFVRNLADLRRQRREGAGVAAAGAAAGPSGTAAATSTTTTAGGPSSSALAAPGLSAQ